MKPHWKKLTHDLVRRFNLIYTFNLHFLTPADLCLDLKFFKIIRKSLNYFMKFIKFIYSNECDALV